MSGTVTIADTIPCDTLQGVQPFYLWDNGDSNVDIGTAVNLGIPLDSLFRPYEQAEPVYRKSLFTHHHLEVKNDNLTPKGKNMAPAGYFVLMILLTSMLLLIFSIRKIKINDLLHSLVDNRALDRMVRNYNLSSLRLMPIGILVVALLTTVVCWMTMRNDGIKMWLLITVTASLAYIFRNGIQRLLGNIFDSKETVSTYINSNYLYHLLLSLIITPLLYLLVYLPFGNEAVAYIIAGFTILCFILRLIRGMKLFLTFSKGTDIYLFYYLCSVEIIPIILVTKLLLTQ